MTGTSSRAGRPRGASPALLVAAGAIVVATLLAGCGSGSPTPRNTVTVWVDPPTGAATDSPTEPVPTVTQTAPASPTVPATLVAGPAKNAVRSFEEGLARLEATTRSRDYAAFRSPSGNIFCRIGPGTAACEVLEGRVDAPSPDVCPEGGPVDIGRVELDPSGAHPVCNSDSIRDRTAPRLRYGTRTHVQGTDVACLSEETGVTCLDPATRHGFWIARGSFATF